MEIGFPHGFPCGFPVGKPLIHTESVRCADERHKSGRAQVRQKGGSDPLFSFGLRPEKQQGVAPALSYGVLLFVFARIG